MVQCNSCGRRCLFCIALFPWLSNNMGWKWQTSSLRKPHQHFIKGRTVIKLRLTDQNNQRTKSQPRSSGSSWVPVLWMENKDAFSRVPLKSVPFVTQHDIWCAVRIHSWLKTKCWKKNDFAQFCKYICESLLSFLLNWCLLLRCMCYACGKLVILKTIWTKLC